MTESRSDNTPELGDETNFYLQRIRQIDRIMEDPVKMLINLAEDGQKKGGTINSAAQKLIYFPTWVSEGLAPKEKEDSLLTQAICCGALQRISRFRRRRSLYYR